MALDEVRTLQAMQIALFGGASGLRDQGLLESALARPQQLFHYEEPRPSLTRLAGAYAFSLIRNHPFVDGNKRIALVTAFAFLMLNGVKVTASEEEAYAIFTALAAGSLSEEELTAWINQNSSRLMR